MIICYYNFINFGLLLNGFQTEGIREFTVKKILSFQTNISLGSLNVTFDGGLTLFIIFCRTLPS